MASLPKWLSVRLRTTWLWVKIPLQSLILQIWPHRVPWNLGSYRVQQVVVTFTKKCRFTLKCLCDMIRMHSLLLILATFLSTFSCIHFMSTFFSRHWHLSRGHRISCPTHHLERTDKKPFSGSIGPRHKTKSWVVAHQSWVARCSPHVLLFS